MADTCRKGYPDCYCAVGWPYDKQCPDCRDTWPEGSFRDSYCVCPPPDWMDDLLPKKDGE
jgi:hypothetical protein